MADDMRDMGSDAAAQMGELAGQLQQDSAFKGYGVQTGLGTTTVGADGSMNLGVGANQAQLDAAASQMGAGNEAYGAAHAGFGSAGGGFGAAQAGLSGMGTHAMTTQGTNAMGQSQAGLAGMQSGMLSHAQQAANNAMGMDVGAREAEIYNRGMAMQQPGLDAQRAQQQAREHAMGRGGMRGSQYGGTAEDAATARAQAQAQNEMSYQSMAQAQSEMMNQANMSNMFGQQGMAASNAQQQYGTALAGIGQNETSMEQARYGMMTQNSSAQANAAAQQAAAANNQIQSALAQQQGAYSDYDRQLAALQLGQGNASMAQTGQLTGAGYAAQLGMGGIEAEINANTAANNLFGDMYGAGMSAIGGIGDNGGNWWEALGF
jgi:hypothetical protein